MIHAIVLGLGLAMDASCVSMTNAMVEKNMKIVKALIMALVFGIFQFAMPLIGYSLGSLMASYLTAFIPIIALVFLSVIGIKMIIECVREKKKGEVLQERKIKPVELFVQGIATSIDALSVGVLYIAEGIGKALISFSIIGGITVALTFAAFFIGKKFGALLKNKACIVGGIILILIGLEIFIESFFV
ncbi:MAG: manganese efflux pump MntP family protein [Clostridia bacterium]|nr:manganese efflux pump MntP family protein [Clostridia bacterium]